MKTKVTGTPHSDLVSVGEMATNIETSIRMMDHVQSGLRQLTFGLAALLPVHDRTPEVDAQLAALHEDEARYHEREAAWLKRNRVIDVKSSSGRGGGRSRKRSPGASPKSTGHTSPSPVSIIRG